MSTAFYDYVRGRSNLMPAGHQEAGLKVYRYLVYLGASQLIESHYPELREALCEDDWRKLIEDFVRQSAWDSSFYADLVPEFHDYLERVQKAEAH